MRDSIRKLRWREIAKRHLSARALARIYLLIARYYLSSQTLVKHFSLRRLSVIGFAIGGARPKCLGLESRFPKSTCDSMRARARAIPWLIFARHSSWWEVSFRQADAIARGSHLLEARNLKILPFSRKSVQYRVLNRVVCIFRGVARIQSGDHRTFQVSG